MSAEQQLTGVIDNVEMPNKSPAIVVMSPTSSQRCTHKAENIWVKDGMTENKLLLSRIKEECAVSENT